jgi:chromosomal replication initiation ATPase DnaA
MNLHVEFGLPVSNYPPKPIPKIRPGLGQEIMREVAAKHGLNWTQFMLGTRMHRYAHARHEAMWLMRKRTSLSYPQMARLFNRDHTTCIYGVRAHERRMACA